MAAEGVNFVTNCEVGKDLPGRASCARSSTPSCCAAARPSRATSSPTEGRNLKGIHFAMEFLHANTKSLLDSSTRDGQYISREGQGRHRHRRRRHRHRLRRHVAAARLPEPGAIRDPAASRRWTRAADNPWPQWPKVYRLDYGQEEAAAIFGDDPRAVLDPDEEVRRRRRGPREGDPHGPRRVGQGQRPARSPRNVPGSEKVFPAQLVLLAMGFLGPENQLLDSSASSWMTAGTSDRRRQAHSCPRSSRPATWRAGSP